MQFNNDLSRSAAGWLVKMYHKGSGGRIGLDLLALGGAGRHRRQRQGFRHCRRRDLKKTGAGNLFTVFGEPDISVTLVPGIDGGAEQVVVQILGVDVYDPTTGEVRSNNTDLIALWMIDTDYNGESFFVRHCYFTGGNDPYARLKKALKADIDEDAWSTLYRTTSRPFAVPGTGRIAIKVINDYGDEVMKVMEVGA